MSALAELFLRRGVHVTGCDANPERRGRPRAPWRARRAARSRACRRSARARRDLGDAQGPPGAGARARARHPRDSSRRGAGRGHRRSRAGRHRRNARQDDDDGHDRDRARGRGPRSRRRSSAGGLRRGKGISAPAAIACTSSRRTNTTARSSRCRRRSPSSRTSRPITSTSTPTSPTSSGPSRSSCAARGTIVLCADDAGANRLADAEQRRKSFATGSTSRDARLVARRIDIARGRVAASTSSTTTSCSVASSCGVPGRHNVLNALAALGAGLALGRRFRRTGAGARRRSPAPSAASSAWAKRGGVSVVDDYAHHPTEIAATLAAARGAFPERRLVVAFQPHLFTRTRDFAREFGAALAAADAVFLTEIYPAREQPIDGRDVGARRRRAHRGRRTRWPGAATRDELADALAAEVRAGRRRAHRRRRRHHQDGPRAARATRRRGATTRRAERDARRRRSGQRFAAVAGWRRRWLLCVASPFCGRRSSCDAWRSFACGAWRSSARAMLRRVTFSPGCTSIRWRRSGIRPSRWSPGSRSHPEVQRASRPPQAARNARRRDRRTSARGARVGAGRISRLRRARRRAPDRPRARDRRRAGADGSATLRCSSCWAPCGRHAGDVRARECRSTPGQARSH